MGYWGSGSFDNDGTRNVMAELVYDFVTRIDERLSSPTAAEWDEVESDELFVFLEVVIALSKQGLPIERLGDSDQLREKWRDFQAMWTTYAEGDSFQLERLASLERLVEQYFEMCDALSG